MKRSVASILLTLLITMSAAALLMPSAQAQTETRVFVAQLSAGQEVAPVVVHPTETNTIGNAIVTIEVTRTGGVITSATTRFDASLSGMASNSVIILAHVHQGAAGVNGPIRIDSNISPAAPVPTLNGTASFIRTGLATPNDVAQAIFDNPGAWYFNVHTALSPGGVARGQLALQQTGGGTAIGAPTLSEWGMILMTLLFVAACSYFLVARSRASSLLATSGHADRVAGPSRILDWKLLATVALSVEVAIALALVLLGAGMVDVLGSLAAGLIVAFTLHLFIVAARRR